MKVSLDLPSYVSSKRLDAYFRGGGAPFVRAEDGTEQGSEHGEGVESNPAAEVSPQGDRPDQPSSIVDLTERLDDAPEPENPIANPAESRGAEVSGDESAFVRKRRRVSGREDEVVPDAPVIPEDVQLGGQTDAPSEGEEPPITAAAGLLQMGEEVSAVDEQDVLRWFKRARIETGESLREGLSPEIQGLIRDVAVSSAKVLIYFLDLIQLFLLFFLCCLTVVVLVFRLLRTPISSSTVC